MDKEILRDKLNTVKAQIKGNSKDAHFTDKLIDDLLSLKGQLCVEPMELDCGKKVGEFNGSSYRITLTNKGVLYHEYGGYNVFVTPNGGGALYETLADIVTNQETYDKSEGEEKERIELMMSAVGWCLQAPKVALGNAELTFDIATKIIDYVRKEYEELMSKELQEENPSEDEEFRNATLALEDIKEEIDKEEDNSLWPKR